MASVFFGTKIDTSQAFDDKGNRLVVTHIKAEPLTVIQVKTDKQDGYWSLQCAVGHKSNKSLTQPQKKHLQGAKLSQAPRFLREIKLKQASQLKPGDQIKITDVFQPGDQIKVTGVSKGRGFAGVIKRWGFAGGPRSHGQSDRQRAPGSIGQRTDPGRVWKGKKMPGHFGVATKTISSLQVLTIDEAKHFLTITGTVPGSRHSLLKLTKTGQAKKPVKLFSEVKPTPKKPPKKSSKKPSQAPSKKPAKKNKPAQPAKAKK